MNNFILFIISIYIILTPFYIFSSGLPQPADMIVGFGAMFFLFSKKKNHIFRYPFIKKVLKLLSLIFLLNTIYWFYFASQSIPTKIYMPPIFYTFNVVFMIMFIYALEGANSKRNINIVAFFIIVSVSLQMILALAGIQGGTRNIDNPTSRATIFFNNPNQLGYYSILMFTLFTILPSKYKKNLFILLYVTFATTYLVLYSGSRAALVSVLFLAGYIVYNQGFKLNLKSMALIMIVVVSIPFVLQTEFVRNKIYSIETRNKRYEDTQITQFQVRAYDRILNHPEYMIWGAGEGNNDRFNSYHNGEIHSGFGTILFSYGILGFILFMQVIYIAIKRNKLQSLMLISPMLLYNLTHQGLRNALFWTVLAIIYIINIESESHITQKKVQRNIIR